MSFSFAIEPAMNAPLSQLSRRAWLQKTSAGFGAMALHGLLHGATNPLAPLAPTLTAKAKRVIFLYMAGGPSQMDLFDPKPLIQKNHGHSVAAPLPEKDKHESTAKLLALGTEIPVRPRGQSGVTISDLLPHTAAIADELCLLRAVQADNNQHGPAALQFHTGVTAEARPSMGCPAFSPSIPASKPAFTALPSYLPRIRARPSSFRPRKQIQPSTSSPMPPPKRPRSADALISSSA